MQYCTLGRLSLGLILAVSLASLELCSTASGTVEENLRTMLRLSAAQLARSQFLDIDADPIMCSCEHYCSGKCFASSCASCPPSTWSFPGGEELCYDPGPLGTGLLCQVNPSTGSVSETACCTVHGPTCTLDKGSCCASGDCTTCPVFPSRTPLFPQLDTVGARYFNSTTNTCS